MWGGKTATNQSYKFSLNGKDYIFRVGRQNPEELSINREIEKIVLERSSKAGISPQLISAYVNDGVILTEFIPSSPLTADDFADKKTIKEIIARLKETHTLDKVGIPIKTVFDVADQRLVKLNHILGKKLKTWINDLRDEYNFYFQNNPQFHALLHGDLYQSNILKNTQNGRIYFVDWEYSYAGLIFEDLAKLCTANWLSTDTITFILTNYFERELSVQEKRIFDIAYFMQQLNFWLWLKIQEPLYPTEPFYSQLAEKTMHHLDQLSKMIMTN